MIYAEDPVVKDILRRLDNLEANTAKFERLGPTPPTADEMAHQTADIVANIELAVESGKAIRRKQAMPTPPNNS